MVQSAEGGSVKAICRPSEHHMPERVEFPKSGCVRNKQVAAVGENRKNGAKTSFLLHQEERPLPAALSCRIVVKDALASAKRLRK